MSGPSVYISLPTSFKPWPDQLPHAIPPPVKERSFRSPFGINKDLFNFALRPEIPFLFASTYIVLVFALNTYNRNRDWKPWWIANQRPFQWFVVVHNVLLALYSSATFLALLRAIILTLPSWDDPNGVAGVADALCKLHGPRGLGDAAAYNTTINIWEVKNTIIKLGYDGNPDPTDVGRLWNEGLAFWGWLFYVSKFYEVVDTLIILAKGKRSATLQTYHHAGAMLCMWAGIRYMSPPIWMFVFVNSFIHALMYAYFTASALGYNVHQGIKRTLTSLQIAQFIFGASYAAAHLFIQYDIPISTPYQVVSTVQKAVSGASKAVSSVTKEVSEVIESPIATATLGALVKKLLLRAAGEEGVAERIRHKPDASIPTPHIPQRVAEKIDHFNEKIFETRWRADWTKVNCIDTSGEAFAIYLNLLYLFPLTWLFGKFFVRRYTSYGKPGSASQAAKQFADAAKEGGEETAEAVEGTGEKVEEDLLKRSEKVTQDAQDLHDQLREDVKKIKEGKYKSDRRVSDRVASFERQVKTAVDKAKEQGKALVNGNGSPKTASSNKQQPAKEEPVNGNAKPQETAPVTSSEEGKENQQPMTQNPSNEQKGEPDRGTAESQATQPDPEDTQANGENEENVPPQSSSTKNTREKEQDSKKEATKDVKQGGPQQPGSKEEEKVNEPEPNDEDTDAMGRSGSIIDLPSEKDKNAQQEAKQKEAGTESEGSKAAPLGWNGS